ncbi:MAG: type II secretion system F family protein [Candidatus Paceibacterota bacterium]|jgi:type II secretory pathway component PulF
MFNKVKTIEKVLFAKHLSLMLTSGVSLAQSVSELADQATTKAFKKILNELVEDIKKGSTIAGALGKYEKDFGNLFISMIKIGEESGTLEESLKHLSKQLEDNYNLKKKVKSAMMYPLLVLGATFAMGFGLAVFIMPKLIGFFKSLDVKLPLVTRIVLGTIGHLEKWGVFYIVGFIVFIILFRFVLKVKKVKLFFHRLLVEAPVFGSLVKKLNVAYFTRTLATLLKSGVTIVEALEISAATLGNLAYRETLEQASGKLRKGENLSSFLKKSPRLIPGMVSKMIEIGEKSGTLEETLFYVADFYEKDVDMATKNLADILEPMLLIIVGLVVGVVAISILMPIYQFTSSIQAG